MNTLPASSNGSRGARRWFRRAHRWAGLSLVVFILFLSLSGMALNHTEDLKLDSRYVGWSWLLDAYGMEEPGPYAGMVSLGSMVIVADDYRVHVLLASGELVETIDLGATLPGVIERIGRVGDYAVIQSGQALYRSDEDITRFEYWDAQRQSEVAWSAEVLPATEGLEALDAAWRGPGLTAERLLLDLHSGRVLGRAGPWLMDAIAVFLILLSLSGLVLSRVRNRRK